jgi:Cdc6-like AAA superfamily ATPase
LTKAPEYENWKSCSTRFLWLHGIPGAGKTVLASFVFEDVKMFCKNVPSNGMGWAYSCCYFRREQDETPHLLRWVINQLCRQMKEVPVEVRELYDAGGQPTTADLVIALAAALRNFQRVYLVIDALDESLNRQNLLNFLIEIINDNNFEKVQLLAMSRKEIDIERAILEVSSDISLSNSHVDKDIRVYIQNHLREDRKFSRWPEELRAEIEAALVKGAKGMYASTVLHLQVSLD